MAQIQTSVGLASGFPITDTVTKLMQLAGKPRDTLVTRNTNLQSQQTALAQLTAQLLAVSYATDSLGKTALFNQQTATSSDPTSLAATVTGNPAPGVYEFTPLQVAHAQQLLSSGFASDSTPIGSGNLTFRFAPNIDQGANLATLNGGQGITRGKIRITDGSGASSEIDLSTAQSVDDVLQAINSDKAINVTAVAGDDGFQLIDNTGQSVSHLKVQEVDGGTTAASLGLAGIDTAAGQAQGRSLMTLTSTTPLSALNNGAGIKISQSLPDISYALSDGLTSGTIDLSPLDSGNGTVQKEVTLGDVLQKINAAAPGKLQATISADGTHLVVADLTHGDQPFSFTSAFDSRAVEDLGLGGPAVGGVITGTRILSGLKTVLLSRLNGGKGVGQLGTINLTDRNGATATVDLSQAQTLQDVIAAVNSSHIGISARINPAHDGIELDDTTGATTHDMVVANGADNLGSADKLKIAVSGPVTSVNSGDLHAQAMAYDTQLANLNGGAGVARDTFSISDSTGATATVDLTNTSIQTVGDVVQAINRLPLHVHADLNDTGDGIAIQDLGQGGGTLSVSEGNSTTAADLGLLQTATAGVINGSMTRTVQLGATDTLSDLVQKINTLGAGVSAATFNDGSSNPLRLLLTSQQVGKAGHLILDTSQAGFSVQETTQAQNALLVVGDPQSAASSVLVSSSSNQFQNVLPGATLQIQQPAAQPVMITVAATASNLVSGVQSMVDNFNTFAKQLSTDTAYNSQTDTSAVLTGDTTTIQLGDALANMLSGQFFGAGSIHSLAEVGISFNNDGTLAFDSTRLQAQFDANPAAVKQFFTDAKAGVSAKLHTLINSLAGPNTSTLAYSSQALQDQIDQNQTRIDLLNKQLSAQQQLLYTQFYNMDTAIGKMKNALAIINNIQPIDPLWASGSTTSTNTSSAANPAGALSSFSGASTG